MSLLAKLFDQLEESAADHQPISLVEIASAPTAVDAQTAKTASIRPTRTDRPAPAEQQAAIVEQQVDEPQHVIRTAATASPAWREVRDQYHAHIFACRACYAPLGRHCAVGAELRAIYDSTPWS
ncbi:hypothetical protein [Azotobacter vinelandii]|uniref:hypothetical protein n=1 Tax=Azotobacter vinelandii TaxID=354 RepID=UPI000B01335C|nr:hypothetical protein [Azotobacter vinelandii]